MLSRRRQTRHLIHATLTPTTSSSSTNCSSGRSTPSHHFYSQAANLSITLSHSNPSIICSSSTSKSQPSSYETLKQQYATLNKARNSSNNNGSLQTVTTPKGLRRRTHSLLREQTEFPIMSLGKVMMGGFFKAGLIKKDPRLFIIANKNSSDDYTRPKEEVMFKPSGSDSLKKYPNNGSSTSSTSSQTFQKNGRQRDLDVRKRHFNPKILNFLVEKQPSSSIFYPCSKNQSNSESSETWKDSSSAHHDHHHGLLLSSWPSLGQLSGGSNGLGTAATFIETFNEPEVNQKPIRVNIEPLLFAMSPLCSETESLESQFPLKEDPYPYPGEDGNEESGEMSSVLSGEDENDHDEVLSNTLLAPIDIPGTHQKKIHSNNNNMLSSLIHSSSSSSFSSF